MTDTPIKGLTVLVTGAGSPEGAAIARALGMRGANLHLADGNEITLADVTRPYRDETRGGIKLHSVQIDIAAGLEALAMECEDADVLVHAAIGFSTEKSDDDSIRRAWVGRVLGAVTLAREMRDGFEARGRGLIILPLPDENADTHARMAAAALRALAEDRDDVETSVVTMAVPFAHEQTAETIADFVQSWWEVAPT